MTKREEVVAAKRAAITKRASVLTDEIEDHSTNLTALYAERLGLWKQAVKLGMTHAQVAGLFRVKTVTVSVALSRDAHR